MATDRQARAHTADEAAAAVRPRPAAVGGALAPWGAAVFGRPASATGRLPVCAHSSPPLLDQLLLLPPSKGTGHAAADGAAVAAAAAAAAAAVRWRVSLEGVWHARRTHDAAEPPAPSPL